MTKLVLQLLLLAGVVAVSSGAKAADAPPDPCFDGKLPFFQNFSRLGTGAEDTAKIFTNTCYEMRNWPRMYEEKNLGDRLMDTVTYSLYALTGKAAASFDNMDGNDAQRAFKAELKRIKDIPDPLKRIRLVYELVARSQGGYDYASYGKNTMLSGNILGGLTPSNILNNANQNGTAGVCYDMAVLFAWSLQQVARYSGSNSMALGATDFSADVIAGDVPFDAPGQTLGRHAWVRVNLPQIDEQGRLNGFNHIDLDTTYYPQQFSPLMPRRSGLTTENRELALKQCDEIKLCLASRSLFSDDVFGPATKATPAPAAQ